MKDVVVTGVSTSIEWGPLKIFIKKGSRVFDRVRKQAHAERLQNTIVHALCKRMVDCLIAKRLGLIKRG